MIPANEIRIGNWILWGGTPQEVDELIFYGKLYHKIDPILLTPEILEECGFTQLENKFTFDKGKLSIHLPSLSYKKGRTYFNSWCIIEHAIQYLHQLQNLYFALTGTELIIKLPVNTLCSN